MDICNGCFKLGNTENCQLDYFKADPTPLLFLQHGRRRLKVTSVRRILPWFQYFVYFVSHCKCQLSISLVLCHVSVCICVCYICESE